MEGGGYRGEILPIVRDSGRHFAHQSKGSGRKWVFRYEINRNAFSWQPQRWGRASGAQPQRDASEST